MTFDVTADFTATVCLSVNMFFRFVSHGLHNVRQKAGSQSCLFNRYAITYSILYSWAPKKL